MQMFFKAEDGAKNVADRTASTACHKYINDMIHEARV
jgi:hypothetical protein